MYGLSLLEELNTRCEIYETNGIVRMIVNMVGSILKGILGIFKKN